MNVEASGDSGTDGGSGQTPGPVRPPSLVDALIPLISLAVLIGLATVLFAPDPTNGALQVALLVGAMIAALVAMKNGHTWEEVARAGTRSVSSVVGAIFILLAVGALIGTWNLAGTIPTLVAYGIRYLQPEWFYPATALIRGAVALSVGSSWTTAGTIGIGLVGVAPLIGLSPVVTAGAVVSGAYLGDKLSPLSATTVAGGTGTSPLVPWSSCGASMAAVLGVPGLAYLPYAVFNVVHPVLAVLYGYIGFRVVSTPRSPSESGEAKQAVERASV